MPALDPLIATRTHIPPVRADLLPRPGLLRLLDQAADLPLTLISAPPGFGKTTLAAAWLHQKQDEGQAICAWLTLQPSDNQPSTFWRYFIAALRQALPGFGGSLLELLAASAPLSSETVATSLVNELDGLTRPVLLVLDDAHALHLREIHAGLNLLLDHAPEGFHLILTSREDPPLALSRRRARRQVLEIRAADLRFQAEETARYFQQSLNLALDSDQVRAIDRLVEGWVVGLQLTALTLKEQSDPAAYLLSLSKVDREVDFFVAEYLVNEVLTAQPREVREFLLRTSVLDQLSAPLCEAVMHGCEVIFEADEARLLSPYAALLERLERGNLFLTPLDPQREWYRYHRQFAALLRERLRRQYGREEIARLQTLASRWFEDNGDPAGAIDYAVQGADYERAATLLQRYAPRFFLRADLPQFLDWVYQVPAAVRARYPGLGMAAAWAGLATNQTSEVANLLDAVESRLGRPAGTALGGEDLEPGLKAALLEILVLRLRLDDLTSQNREKLAFLKNLTAALETLPDDQMGLFSAIHSLKPVVAFYLGIRLESNGEARAALPVYRQAADLAAVDYNHHIVLLSLSHLGHIQMQFGQFDRARQTFESALAQAEELGAAQSPFAGLVHNGLGWLEYQANCLAEARERFEVARRLAGPWSTWESLIPATLGLAAVHQALDNPAAALHEVEHFLRTEKCPLPGLFYSLEVERARLRAENGDALETGKWLSEAPQPDGEMTFMFCPPPELTHARLLLLLDRETEARQLLGRFIQKADEDGRVMAADQARVELARALAACGEIRPAAESLLAAIQSVQAEGFANGAIRVFLDGGQAIRRLLLVIRSTLAPGTAALAYIRSLLTYFVSGEEAFANVENDGRLIEPLSDREREVLALLAEGLSNKDIAARLVVSLATVKTHVANIYQKLDASSRTQAVARAQNLGLLRN